MRDQVLIASSRSGYARARVLIAYACS